MTAGIRLEYLQPGVRLSGLLPQPVAILAVLPHGSEAVTITYQDGGGGLGQRLLYRTDEPSLSIEAPTSRWQFDADPAEFRLVAEPCASARPDCTTRWSRCPPAPWAGCHNRSRRSTGSCRHDHSADEEPRPATALAVVTPATSRTAVKSFQARRSRRPSPLQDASSRDAEFRSQGCRPLASCPCTNS